MTHMTYQYKTLLLKHIFWAMVVAIFSVGTVHAAEIKISAAASLTDALKELATDFSRKNSGSAVQFNFGSSGSLAKQVGNGAPIDIFISANTKWMDFLVSQGKIAKNTVRPLAMNTLVFVGPKDSGAKDLTKVTSLTHIAMGSPASVPAGQYAEQALKAAGLYDALSKQNKLILAKDVRQALTYADHGDADGAFVYQTDAKLAQKTVVLFTVPEKLYDKIVYPIALTLSGEKNESAKLFYSYLKKPEAAEILKKYGFQVAMEEK